MLGTAKHYRARPSWTQLMLCRYPLDDPAATMTQLTTAPQRHLAAVQPPFQQCSRGRANRVFFQIVGHAFISSDLWASVVAICPCPPASLGGVISERSGVANTAIEGLMPHWKVPVGPSSP